MGSHPRPGCEQLATITDLSDTEVGLTLSAADASSTGGMATILPVGDGKAYWPWADHWGMALLAAALLLSG